MAYTGLAGNFDIPESKSGGLRRWLATFFAPRSEVAAGPRSDRKLAGPLPGDLRARGYLADLDIEIGF